MRFKNPRFVPFNASPSHQMKGSKPSSSIQNITNKVIFDVTALFKSDNEVESLVPLIYYWLGENCNEPYKVLREVDGKVYLLFHKNDNAALSFKLTWL